MATSYNGWPAHPDKTVIGVTNSAVARGTSVTFPPGLKGGDVAFILGYVAGELHRRVEKAGEGVWGYAYRQNRNASNLSCHASGTAFDWNAPRHPNGKAGTFTPAKVVIIRAILKEVENSVKWGGDFSGTKDEMHFEICVNATTLKAVTSRLKQRLAASAARNATPYWWTENLFRGMKDRRDVRIARHNLKIALTGAPEDDDFDDAMNIKVRELQKRAGLPVTGVIDRPTAKAIG